MWCVYHRFAYQLLLVISRAPKQYLASHSCHCECTRKCRAVILYVASCMTLFIVAELGFQVSVSIVLMNAMYLPCSLPLPVGSIHDHNGIKAIVSACHHLSHALRVLAASRTPALHSSFQLTCTTCIDISHDPLPRPITMLHDISTL